MLCKECKEKPIHIKKRQLCLSCYAKWRKSAGGVFGWSGGKRSKANTVRNFAKKYPGIIRDMRDARNKHYHTIIGLQEKYGITRERIRQIYNMIYRTPQKKARTELAKRRKKESKLVCINDPRRKVADYKNGKAKTGAIYERLFMEKCESFGFDVEILCNKSIDLKVNGYFVEIKSNLSATKRNPSSLTCHCGYYATASQTKKADFFACYHPTEKSFFIVPNIWRGLNKNKAIHISEYKTDYCSSKNNYWEYKNAYYQLAIPKDVKKLKAKTSPNTHRPEMEVATG